jgi:predicted nucleic acid-binding protein
MSHKYVIDASAWFEYFYGTPKGIRIKPLIEHEEIATSIVAVGELADKFARINHRFDVMLQFIQRRAAIIDLSVSLALKAAQIKKEARTKKENPNRERSIGPNRSSDLGFSMADGVHMATAQQENAILVTADNDFAGMENVMVI